MLVPAFTGWGTPYWDPNARGLLIGLTRDSKKGHIARAALEGIALSVSTLVGLAQQALGNELGELAVDGGAAASDLLLQSQANSTGLNIRRPSNIEITAKGAALLAGLESGAITDLRQQINSTADRDEIFTPKIDSKERDTILSRWDNAVKRSLNWHA